MLEELKPAGNPAGFFIRSAFSEFNDANPECEFNASPAGPILRIMDVGDFCAFDADTRHQSLLIENEGIGVIFPGYQKPRLRYDIIDCWAHKRNIKSGAAFALFKYQNFMPQLTTGHGFL